MSLPPADPIYEVSVAIMATFAKNHSCIGEVCIFMPCQCAEDAAIAALGVVAAYSTEDKVDETARQSRGVSGADSGG